MSTHSPRPLTIVWAAALTLLGVVAVQIGPVVAAGIRVLWAGGDFRQALIGVTADPLSLALAPAFGLGIACWAGTVLHFPEEPMGEAVGMRPISSAQVGFAVIAGSSLQFPLSELGNLLHEVWPVPLEHQLALQRLLEPQGVYAGLVAIVAVVLVPAFFEELLFRGVLLSGLRRRYGDGWAVVVSAVLFGIVHLESAAVAYATLAGLLFGWVRLRTGSLFATIVMHGAVNAVPLLLPSTVLPIRGFNVVTEEVYHLGPWLFLITLASSTLGVWLLCRHGEEV